MKRPNPFLYLPLGFLVKIFAIIKGQRIMVKSIIKRPAIILSNHTSFYDFIYTTAAMYPARVNYLGAKKYFHDPLTAIFMKIDRAIPKSLMQVDPKAIRSALKLLQNKGILAIFPEGQISATGTSLQPAYAIAKLIKKASVNVYIVKHKNAYFVNPPWSNKTFRGRVETEKKLIIDKDELEVLTNDEIYKVIVDNLFFSSSNYNKEKRYSYKMQNIANLENMIYQCPDCLHEGLVSSHDRLKCPKCHHELVYDRFGLLNDTGIDELYSRQEKRFQKIIDDDPQFFLEAVVKLFSFRNNRLVEVGSGNLRLDPIAYTYHGSIDGEAVIKTFNVSKIPTLPSDIGKNVQIYENDQIYQFEFEIPYLTTKFILAGEYLHKKSVHR
jgi:1-acyl-sn-glycerol-3-phosphate acyltransferase/uncharacterized protein YbaR (Trm112 family)